MQLRKRTTRDSPPPNKRRTATAATIAPARAASPVLRLRSPAAAATIAPAVEPVPTPPPAVAAAGTMAPARVRPLPYLFVKLLNGTTISLRFNASDSVLELKDRLSPLANAAPEAMRIIFAGRQLEDGKVLSDYNIQMESTLHMVLRLCGD